MFEGIDWDKVGQAVVGLVMGLGTIGGVAYGAVMKHKARVAKLGADVAASDADKTVSDAQLIVYDSLSKRVEALDGDVKQLRQELDTERRHSRRLELLNKKLELHILRLESLMKAAGIEVPIIIEVDTQHYEETK